MYYINLLLALTATFLSFSTVSVISAQTISIKAVSIIDDQDGSLNITDVMKLCPSPPCSSEITPNELSPGVKWLAFPLTSIEQVPHMNFYSFVKHRESDFYFVRGKNILKHIKGGIHHGSSQEYFFSLTDVAKIPDTKKPDFLWLRLNLEVKQINLFELIHKQELLDREYMLNSFKALYFGVVGSMIFYNLIFLIATRAKLHLYYVTFILTIFLPAILVDIAHVFQFGIIYVIATFFVPLSSILAVAFTHLFLKTHISSSFSSLDKIVIILSLTVTAVAFMLSSEQRLQFSIYSTLLCTIWCIYSTGKRCIEQPSYDKVVFLFSWLAFFIGIAIFGGVRLQVIPINPLTYNSYRIGQMIEVSTISMILVLRHKNIEVVSRLLEKKNSSFSNLLNSLHSEILRYHQSISEYLTCFEPNSDQEKQGKERTMRSLKSLLSVALQMNRYKTTNGKNIEITAVSLKQVVEELFFLFEYQLEKKKVSLISPDQSKDIKVKANKSILIHQILSNIISNAIKFSEKGSSIKLRIQAKSQYIEILISDKGIGIPKEVLSNIFKHDQDSHRTGTEGETGTGFGIPLAKLFTERLGGYIRVHSKPMGQSQDHGTTFVIGLLKASDDIIAS